MKNMKRAKRRKRNINKLKKVHELYKREFGGGTYWTEEKIKEAAHKNYNQPGEELYRCDCSYCRSGKELKLKIAEIREQEQIEEWQTDESLMGDSIYD